MKIPYSMLGIPDREILLKELDEQIDKAIESLTPRQRDAFILSECEGKSCKHISSLMGCSIDTVSTLKQKAIKNLRKKLRPYKEGNF